MAKHNYYAVKKGKKIGIFDNWNECKDSVDGFSGAEYKSFASKEEAQAYLDGIDLSKKLKEYANESGQLIAYIDGSYSEEANKYGFGCVIVTPKGETIKDNGFGDNPGELPSRNVAGELRGAIYAIDWAISHGYDKVIIRHDYEGISKWFTKEWKASSYPAIKYVEYLEKCKDIISISFEKVVAHSGDIYNEEADRLAKLALVQGNKVKSVEKSGDSWFTIVGVDESEIDAILQLMKDEIKDLDIYKSSEASYVQYQLVAGKEKVVLKIYKNSNKTVIQGKQLTIFNLLMSYITELLDIDQVTEVLNECYNLEIPKENIEEQFIVYLPHVNKLPKNLSSCLHQAVYNLNFDGDMYDYTYLCFPVLKSLEGHLKYILDQHNISCGKEGFSMFTQANNGAYKLDPESQAKIGSPKKIEYINKCYNRYRAERHTLFHWGQFLGDTDDTRIIPNKNASDKIIKEVLSLIDEYYTLK